MTDRYIILSPVTKNVYHSFVFPSGTAQFQTCYDNAATNCGGNVITVGVSNASDCCLGDGFWFRVSQGQCVRCIGE